MRRDRAVVPGLLLVLCAGTAGAQSLPVSLCGKFSRSEIATLLGTAVEEPLEGPGICQWWGKDDKSAAVISAIPASYYAERRQEAGFAPVPGIGKRAFSVPDARGGWNAIAETDRLTVNVQLLGPTAKREAAVAMLRRLVAKL
jgi:hypothetical protein